MNYGKRECLACGKTFTATYLQQVTCSDECKKKRLSEQKRNNARARWPKHRAMIEEMRDKLALLTQERDELKAQVEKLEHENAKLHNELSDMLALQLKKSKETAPAATKPDKPVKAWCERLKMKSEELPCGDRPECFAEPICDRAVRNG